MGHSFNYKCSKCGYSARSCGGLDYGMNAVLETYICVDCNELVDVLVGECGIKYPEETLKPKQKKEFYLCEECRGKNILKWDIRKKPCPKCKGRMKIDPHAATVLWD